jgi:hypothetical protein
MGNEVISLFTLSGTLQKEDVASNGRGKFTVVNKDKSGTVPMPFAG